MSSQTSSGVISGILSTLSFGLITAPLIAFIFAVDGKFALEDLYTNLNLDSAAKIQTYFIILLAWGVGGLIAGVRTKNGTKGFLSGFFGAFTGALLILLLFISTQTSDIFNIDINSIVDTIPGFMIGMIGLMLAASVFGYGAGRQTQEKKKTRPRPKSKKAWSDKSKWNCSKCGKEIPPGKMNCPNCGAGVIQ
jgi:hypothetical protein